MSRDEAAVRGIVVTGAPPAAFAGISERYAARGFRIAAADTADDDVEAGVAAIRAAMDALHATVGANARIAVVGFAGGGRFAYLAATRLDAAAAVAFHGAGIGRHLDEAARVRVPLSFHFGDDDEHVPLTEVRAIKGALEGFATVSIYRYPGVGAGFALIGDPGYAPEAAREAERRAFAMLDGLR